MNWNQHKRWAEEYGIPEPIADFVNRVIDGRAAEELPVAYRRDVERFASALASAKGAKRGNSALGLVIATHVKEDHDGSRKLTTDSGLYADVHRHALRKRGQAYLDAWYLHHHLDYLKERNLSDTSFAQLMEEYRRRYPQTYEPEIAEFCIENESAIEADL